MFGTGKLENKGKNVNIFLTNRRFCIFFFRFIYFPNYMRFPFVFEIFILINHLQEIDRLKLFQSYKENAMYVDNLISEFNDFSLLNHHLTLMSFVTH